MTAIREQPLDAIELLPFHCPFPAAIHPQADAIERHCVEWIDRFELYGSAAQRERLIAHARRRGLRARAADAPTPSASPTSRSGSTGASRPTTSTTTTARPAGAPPTSSRSARRSCACARSRAPRFALELPYNDALRDLTNAILRHATPAQRIEWAHTARAWFFGMAWDVANAERGVPPSLNDYLAMRMHTGGLASWATTLNIANGIELTPAQAASGPVRALVEAWSTFCLLLNDLMSFAKEARNGDSSSNVVSVIAHERGCTPADGDSGRARPQRPHRDALPRPARAVALAGRSRGATRRWRGSSRASDTRGAGSSTGASAPRATRPAATRTRRRLQSFPGWAEEPTRREPRAAAAPLDRLVVGGAHMIRAQELARLRRERRPPESPPLAEQQPRLPVSRRLVRRRVRRRAAAWARAASALHGRGPRRLPHAQRRRARRRAVLPAPRRAPRLRRLGRGRGRSSARSTTSRSTPTARACAPATARDRRSRGSRSARCARSTARSSCGTTRPARRRHGRSPRSRRPASPPPFRHLTTIVDHPQDIVENAVDIGHIGPVHGYRNARVRRPFEAHGPSFTIAASGERVFPLTGPVEIVFDIVAHGLGHIWVDGDDPAAARGGAVPGDGDAARLPLTSRSASASRCASGTRPASRSRAAAAVAAADERARPRLPARPVRRTSRSGSTRSTSTAAAAGEGRRTDPRLPSLGASSSTRSRRRRTDARRGRSVSRVTKRRSTPSSTDLEPELEALVGEARLLDPGERSHLRQRGSVLRAEVVDEVSRASPPSRCAARCRARSR